MDFIIGVSVRDFRKTLDNIRCEIPRM